jgi:putative nucleotidyltransferase with HDIG domain
MSGDSYIASERLRASLAVRARPLVNHERRGEILVGGAFVAAAALLAKSVGSVSDSTVVVAALYVAVMAVVAEVRLEIGANFTVPTQAVFVPMMFALPAGMVPLLTLLALTMSMLPAIARRHRRASRLWLVPGDCWFAIGGPAVLVLAGDHSPDGRYGILVLALGAQLACDFAANVLRERLNNGMSIRELAGEAEQAYAIDIALTSIGLAMAMATVHHQWAVILILPLLAFMRWISRERRARMEQLIELNDAYRGTALLLGDVVEADDSYTGEHCKDVVQLALAVARHLGLDLEALREVEFTALLHDIGKIAVPKTIVNKPGALNDEEWAIIKTHTVEGQRMLERVGGFMREVGMSVRSHHERWDGGGYPDGLSGNAIPFAARIVSCCDAYNAMTTNRPYRKALPVEVAVGELEANSGTQFDPLVVRAVLTVVSESAPRALERAAAVTGS